MSDDPPRAPTTADGADANRRAAQANSGFYDGFWQRLGVRLDYDELLRLEFIERMLEQQVGRRDLRLLDLGCGRGWLAPVLARSGTVTGVDFSPAGIEFARAHFGDHGRFLLADQHQPSWGLAGETPFDVVVCSEVIEHVLDQAAFMVELAPLVAAGGWLVLTTPNGDVRADFDRAAGASGWQQPVENWISRADLAALLARSGFAMVHDEGGAISWRLPVRRGVGFIERVLRRCGLYPAYARAIRPIALYQLVVARRTG